LDYELGCHRLAPAGSIGLQFINKIDLGAGGIPVIHARGEIIHVVDPSRMFIQQQLQVVICLHIMFTIIVPSSSSSSCCFQE
jgi:hypothetical protein